MAPENRHKSNLSSLPKLKTIQQPSKSLQKQQNNRNKTITSLHPSLICILYVSMYVILLQRTYYIQDPFWWGSLQNLLSHLDFLLSSCSLIDMLRHAACKDTQYYGSINSTGQYSEFLFQNVTLLFIKETHSIYYICTTVQTAQWLEVKSYSSYCIPLSHWGFFHMSY